MTSLEQHEPFLQNYKEI